ncbi:MAG: RNA-binding S4 domain-containing protein [Paludibacteraceae bacterium]|nr:RNA-binding S4 domain-containing protein [Paludibacteraceae bacterium]
MSEVRVDKYLWAMRIYKTRSIAADACKNGRISMNGVQLKPSRTFKIGDMFNVRKGPITYTYKVLQLTENRLGAKLVPEYMQDCTSPQQLELLELARLAGNGGRDRGTGRPTKKDRRDIEVFMSDNYLDEIDDWNDEMIE